MSSSIDPSLPPLLPSFQPSTSKASPETESPSVSALIAHLSLHPHPEGGYFVETDRDPRKVLAPWTSPSTPDTSLTSTSATHNASTTIHYLLTPTTPLGHFHRNRARTIHTLHRGRGRYVIIHADEVASESCPSGYGSEDVPEKERWTGKARVETFVVGQDVLKGERVQWIVEGGKYKCSYLLPDRDGEGGERESEGLLISETVVPGFEFGDHDFLTGDRMEVLVEKRQAEEVGWMVRKE